MGGKEGAHSIPFSPIRVVEDDRVRALKVDAHAASAHAEKEHKGAGGGAGRRRYSALTSRNTFPIPCSRTSSGPRRRGRAYSRLVKFGDKSLATRLARVSIETEVAHALQKIEAGEARLK